MGRALIEGQKELAKIISFFVLSPAPPALLVLLNAVEFLFNWDRYEISYWGGILHRRYPSGIPLGPAPPVGEKRRFIRLWRFPLSGPC